MMSASLDVCQPKNLAWEPGASLKGSWVPRNLRHPNIP